LANEKNHLYSIYDLQKDNKQKEVRGTQQQYSRYSVSNTSSINSANLQSNNIPLQKDNQAQIGIPYDDTKGVVGASTQIVSFNTYGSQYTFYELTGDVDFAFDQIPTGRNITFTLDILVNQVTGVTIGFPQVLTPPVLDGNDGDRYVLYFVGVNRTDPTGVNPPVQTFEYIGGSFSAEGTGSQTPWLSNIDAAGFDLNGLGNIDFDGISATIQGLANLDFFQASQSINSLATGLLHQVDSTQNHLFAIGGVFAARFEDSGGGVLRLDMIGHSIEDIKDLRLDSAATFALPGSSPGIGYDLTSTEMILNVPSANNFSFTVNNVQQMFLDNGNMTFRDGFQVIFNPNITNAGVNVGLAVGDPSATNNGDLWYNSTTDKLRTKENNVNVDVVGGGTGSQTPWLSNIDADGFSLQDLSNIEFRATIGAPGAGITAIYADLNGMISNVPTGDDFAWNFQGVETYHLNVNRFSASILGKDLGDATIPWETLSIRDIEIETGGTLTTNKNGFVSDSFGIKYNVPSGDFHTFFINGITSVRIQEDEIRFTLSGRQHRISATSTALQLVSELETDTVQIFTGASRTNATIQVSDVATTWLTETDDVQAVLLQLIQNNNTPAPFRTLGNIDFMAENTISNDTVYARVSASSQNITSTSENGLLQLGVISGGTLVSGIDIEGSGSGGINDALIGFFGVSPVAQQSPAPNSAAIITALENLGLFG